MSRNVRCGFRESRTSVAVAGLLFALLVMAACSGTTVNPVAVETTPPDGDPVEAGGPVADVAPLESQATSDEAPVAAFGAAVYASDSQALARGRGLFRAVCTGYCHTTRRSDRVAPDLFDCAWPKGGTDSEIFQIITDGVVDTQMLGFGGKLPDEDLWKIVAYIRAESKCNEGAG